MIIWTTSHTIHALADIVVPSVSACHARTSSKSKSNIIHEYLDKLIQVLAEHPIH
jgi:hypothetical protein